VGQALSFHIANPSLYFRPVAILRLLFTAHSGPYRGSADSLIITEHCNPTVYKYADTEESEGWPVEYVIGQNRGLLLMYFLLRKQVNELAKRGKRLQDALIKS
jgi:hypothetical protein